MCSGTCPSVSVALLTHSATAIGSVHPTAGSTSDLTSSMILCLSVLSIMMECLKDWTIEKKSSLLKLHVTIATITVYSTYSLQSKMTFRKP